MEKKEIIERISKLRTRANLSARALSLNIGMNKSYINRMETKQDFLPSMDAFLDIIESCGSTPAEFFYYDINQYAKDKEIIELLSKASDEKKTAIISLLKN